MKKKVSILITITLILNIILQVFGNLSFAVTTNQTEEKKHPESYWSTQNAPMFYGATKITLQKGIIDEFDVLDARFRIFAKDFEDGDLTPYITHSGKVKLDEVGKHEITYTVTDSHKNTTTLVVPVIVTEEEDIKIKVERTIYTTPSVWNMDLAEFSRCNYGDRQILGVYLSNNQSIKARIVSSESALAINFFNNDQYTESSTTIPLTGEWVTLENRKDGIGYESVPLLRTTVLSKENTVINKSYVIELQYDETIEPLNYYHYLDDEQAFRIDWLESGNRYGVIESETMLLVVPFLDMSYMTNYYNNGFTSLDKFLEYYQKVVEKMDEYVGLEFNPEKMTNQNVRTKYVVKANRHGVGAAYYAGDHVGVNNASMASFFEMNWGGLHELAHGYQGSLGKGEMQLGEVSNNIIGHYIQIDKSIYFHSGNWLGELSVIEEERNAQRISGKTFLEVDEPSRLYVIINLLNTFEKGTTYGKLYSWYREQLYQGRRMTNQDAYVEGIAELYKVNIIPYMEAWGLKISDEAKANVYENNYPLVNILKDMVNDNTLQTVMSGEGIDRKYGLVSNETLQKYTSGGVMSLQMDIDDITQIQGKVIHIKDGKDIIKSIKIENNQIEEALPIGTYFLQMPVINGYSYQYAYVQIKEDMKNTHIYTYEKLEDIDYDNYLMFRVLGYNYDTIAYQLTFKEQYTKAEIRYPNQSAMSGNEYVKIYDTKGDIVTEDIATGGYFDFNKGTHEITLEPGYVIEICYPNKFANKVVVYNTLTNAIIPEYKAIGTITRYTVIENGIIREDISEENAEDVAYAQLKVHLVGILEAYKQKVTEEELQNKRINYEEKTQIIDAYNQLREQDKIPYTSLINKIKQGGIPKITVITPTLEFEKGTPIDVYTFIKAVDNEDGEIVIDKNSTVVRTNLKNDEAGTYFVTYEVSDSDRNIGTKTIEIIIIADEEDVEIPEIPEIPEEGEEEEKPDPNPPNEEEKPIPPTDGEEEKPVPPTDGEEEVKPPEPDEEDKEDEETTPPTTEPDDEEDKEDEEITPPSGDDNTPPEIDDGDKEEEEIRPPEIEEEDKGEVLPPQVDEENKEETVVPEEDKNSGNVNNSSSENQSIVDSSNDNQENIGEELENTEDTTEMASLDETEDMNVEEVKEEEFIESIQGTYEDEFGENIEDINSNEVAQEENHIVIKVFIIITIIAGVTFGIVRRKIKANKRY